VWQGPSLPLLKRTQNGVHAIGQNREHWVLNPGADTPTQLEMLAFLGKLFGIVSDGPGPGALMDRTEKVDLEPDGGWFRHRVTFGPGASVVGAQRECPKQMMRYPDPLSVRGCVSTTQVLTGGACAVRPTEIQLLIVLCACTGDPQPGVPESGPVAGGWADSHPFCLLDDRPNHLGGDWFNVGGVEAGVQ
jgi:hypothetical protein